MPQPVSLAFLGCGVATRTHSKVLARWGGDVQRYYASRDPKLAEEYSRQFGGAGSFGAYAAAMTDPRVQAVVVCTPPDSRAATSTPVSRLPSVRRRVTTAPVSSRRPCFSSGAMTAVARSFLALTAQANPSQVPQA